MKLHRIEAGGTEYRLAPLTFGQVESLAAHPDPWDALLWSLANAGESFDRSSLKEQLDIPDFEVLYEAVLEQSGLAKQDGKGEPADFPELRCLLITALGWTSQECDDTPFPVVLDLCSYWSAHLPTSSALEILLSVFTTWQPGPGRRDRTEASSKEEVAQVVTQHGGFVQDFDRLPLEMQQLLDRDLHIFEKRNERKETK